MTSDTKPKRRSKSGASSWKKPSMESFSANDFTSSTLAIYDNLLNTEPRQEQRKMLETLLLYMSNAISGETPDRLSSFLAEAPVGTGKSYVMLLAAFGAFFHAGLTTTISTHTKVLQNQLASKDIPALKRSLPSFIPRDAVNAWKFGAVKGMNNYVCPKKIDLLSEASGTCDLLYRSPCTRGGGEIITRERLAEIRKSSVSSLLGTEALFEKETDAVLASVRASRGTCEGESCIYFKSGCPAKIASRVQFPLTITNHSFLTGILRSARRGEESGNEEIVEHAGGMFDSDILFFDEAHHLSGYASEENLLSFTLESEMMRTLLSSPLPVRISNSSALNATCKARDDIWRLWAKFIGEASEGRIRMIGKYRDALLPMLSRWEKGLNIIASQGIPGEWMRSSLKEIDAAKNMFSLVLSKITSEQCSREMNKKSAPKKKSLLKDMETVFPKAKFSSFVSGTLFIDGSTSLFEAEAGISPTFNSLRVQSPFQGNKVMIWIPSNLPSPSEDEKAHDDAIVDFCLDYVPDYVADNLGGVLILCSSLRRKKLLATALRPAVVSSGRVLLEQGDGSRQFISRTFSQSKSPVLVASASFREGFDAPGHKLTWVIMDKLPFPCPEDKALKNRAHYLKREGFVEEAFSYFLSLLKQTLAQSSGRLIRSQKDWGAVTILDPRLLKYSKSWNIKDILSVPPEKWITDTPPSEVWIARSKSLTGRVASINPFLKLVKQEFEDADYELSNPFSFS